MGIPRDETINQKSGEPDMALRTFYPMFKYTLKWEIASMQELFNKPIGCPTFQVEPGSSWHVSLLKEDSKIRICVHRQSTDLDVRIHCTMELSDAEDNSVYYKEEDFVPSDEDDCFDMLKDATDVMENIMFPMGDQLMIKIELKVTKQNTQVVSSRSRQRS